MESILQIDITDWSGGHKDLHFSIAGLTDILIFDTYYFALEIEPVNSINDIKNAVAELLQYWKSKVSEIKEGQVIYLPIDFSDQYTGCLRVAEQRSQLVLTYGDSRKEGWAVSPLNPGDYYKSITDFNPDSEKQLELDKLVFIAAIDNQIKRLTARSGDPAET